MSDAEAIDPGDIQEFAEYWSIAYYPDETCLREQVVEKVRALRVWDRWFLITGCTEKTLIKQANAILSGRTLVVELRELRDETLYRSEDEAKAACREMYRGLVEKQLKRYTEAAKSIGIVA